MNKSVTAMKNEKQKIKFFDLFRQFYQDFFHNSFFGTQEQC